MPSEGRKDATKRARQGELEPPQGASSSSAGAGKRPLEPDGDTDMVCGLDVCDALDETHFAEMYVNDCEGDYVDEVTGVTPSERRRGQSTHGRDEMARKVQCI